MEQKKIRKQLEKNLDAKRYEHTLGVAYTAAALAMCHGGDIEAATVAGLLHDCAKCISDEKRISICEKNDLPINAIERRNPSLLHAKAGSILAAQDYDVEDPEILRAIRSHTTGRPGMTQLEKIIFIADYIEPGRNKAENLDEVRRLAFRDLDEALWVILRDTLLYLRASGDEDEIDPMTQETFDFYNKERAGKGK